LSGNLNIENIKVKKEAIEKLNMYIIL